jgi:hypothetical protein
LTELHFDPDTHTYTLDGKKLPSVTEIIAPITAGKYPPNAGVVQAAAARGTRIHELCALYDMDALPDEFELECVPYVQAWADFCRDYKPEWLYIEQPLYFQSVCDTSFAGTVDRIGCIDGKLCVVDIKTAQSMDRPAKIALATQLHAYQLLASELHITGENFGVQLMKDGTYRLQKEKDIMRKYEFDTASLFWSLRNLYAIVKGC